MAAILSRGKSVKDELFKLDLWSPPNSCPMKCRKWNWYKIADLLESISVKQYQTPFPVTSTFGDLHFRRLPLPTSLIRSTRELSIKDSRMFSLSSESSICSTASRLSENYDLDDNIIFHVHIWMFDAHYFCVAFYVHRTFHTISPSEINHFGAETRKFRDTGVNKMVDDALVPLVATSLYM